MLPWLLLIVAVLAGLAGLYRAGRHVERAHAAQVRAERAVMAAQARIAALQDQIGREHAVLDRLPDPVLLFGPDRVLRWQNHAARSAPAPGIGGVLRHPGFRAALDQAQAEARDRTVELAFAVPIARDLHATVLILPREQPEAPPPLAALLSDRTRERAVERMRADFVANASHELRTPLSSLIGFIATLRGPAADDPEAQARFLGIMAEQAQRMNRLIDDLLSLSRIEVTEHMPPAGRVGLPDLVGRIGAAFAPLLAARRMTLAVTMQPDLPPVTGDEGQLEQVVQNLLDNAIKYGRDGGTVRLAARRALRAANSPHLPGVLLSIGDDGAGIPRAHLPRLTERFYRVDPHRSRAVGGTGLGLAIVKHIVSRHRGSLTIDSTEQVGTEIQVWLPS